MSKGKRGTKKDRKGKDEEKKEKKEQRGRSGVCFECVRLALSEWPRLDRQQQQGQQTAALFHIFTHRQFECG